jgi:hypothetical protein
MPMQPLAENTNADLGAVPSAKATTTTTAEVAQSGAQGAAELHPHGNVIEIGGPAGPEPSRYGDWERRGRCVDF